MEHLESLRKRIREAEVQAPPSPWGITGCNAVGGLTEVGFADDSDLLLVVSWQGRAIFDCRTGSRLARDRAEPDDYWYDGRRQRAKGIGQLGDMNIRLTGLHGGGLSNCGRDGWSIESMAIDWPAESLVLVSPWQSIYDNETSFTKLAVETELRAFGFSDTGESLVIATSSDVTMISWSE